MLNTLTAYIYKMLKTTDQPNTYGAELEAYIVSKQPKSTADVEYYTQEFDRKKHSSAWHLGGYGYGR